MQLIAQTLKLIAQTLSGNYYGVYSFRTQIRAKKCLVYCVLF